MNSSSRRIPEFICASANPDKVAEMTAVLDGVARLAPRPTDIPEVIEDAPDLAGNARLKAGAVARVTGRSAIADDTGLEVDALDGAPGVFSARYAGDDASYEDNVAKLLAELEGVPVQSRTARFRTVAIVVHADGSAVSAEGVVEGRITLEPRGDGGFGYDSVFEPSEGGGLTFAEMSSDSKHAMSHRGRALRMLASKLMADPKN